MKSDMNSPSTSVVAAAIVLAVATGLGIVFLDFQAAESQTNVNSQVSTGAANNATVDLSGGVYVYVLGNDTLSAEYQAALLAELNERGVAAEAAPGIRATYDKPVLFVTLQSWRLSWDPVSPEANATWRMLYAQPGNVSRFGWPEDGNDFSADRFQARFESGDVGPIVMDGNLDLVRDGEFELHDRTSGVVSLAAYDRHVREAVADATVDALLG